MNAYTADLIDIACDRPRTRPSPSHPPLSVHTRESLLATTLAQIGNAPITRNGLDAALDILFAHPDIAPLLTSLDPNTFADRVLPHTHPRFADHWTHIVTPAWEQHVTLQRAMAASAAAPDPEITLSAPSLCVP